MRWSSHDDGHDDAVQVRAPTLVGQRRVLILLGPFNELRIGRHKVAVPESDFVKLSARFVSGSDEEEAQSTLDRKLKMTAHCLALYTVFENPLAASGGSGGSKRSNLQVGNSCAPPEKGRELSFSECNGRGQRVS